MEIIWVQDSSAVWGLGLENQLIDAVTHQSWIKAASGRELVHADDPAVSVNPMAGGTPSSGFSLPYFLLPPISDRALDHRPPLHAKDRCFWAVQCWVHGGEGAGSGRLGLHIPWGDRSVAPSVRVSVLEGQGAQLAPSLFRVGWVHSKHYHATAHNIF